VPKVYISEYTRMPTDTRVSVPAGAEPAIATHVVAIGAGSVQSAAFNTNARFIRLHTDAICSVAFGANPTATADSCRLAANQTEFFGVLPGHKVAVITNT
jgi:hypothetical protein